MKAKTMKHTIVRLFSSFSLSKSYLLESFIVFSVLLFDSVWERLYEAEISIQNSAIAELGFRESGP